jgi:hypothetical protein
MKLRPQKDGCLQKNLEMEPGVRTMDRRCWTFFTIYKNCKPNGRAKAYS